MTDRHSKSPSAWTAWVGVTGLGLSSYAFHAASAVSAQNLTVVFLLAAILPMLVLELFVFKIYRNESSGLNLGSSQDLSFERSAVKLLGFFAIIFALGFFYKILPVYRSTNYFPQFSKFISETWPIFILGALIYFPWADSKMKEPIDGYWMMGALCLGKWQQIDFTVLKNFIRGWIVKGFFTPIMFGFLVNSVEHFQRTSAAIDDFRSFYIFSYEYLFLIDLCFGVIGYICTLRLLDSHIRSAEPSFMGWAVALLCYTPFQENILNRYLPYDDNYFWGDWLSVGSIPYVVWGSLILFFTFVYAWATVSFGFRFSNLTHRGIITSGPYRFTKHPAYISKNITWWLISVPFISLEGRWAAFSHSFLLVGINIIYYLRAKTEERHLSQDPVYVEYAMKMNDRGCFAWIPFFKYKAP